MTREAIETRITQLRDEQQKAHDEMGKLRPRMQFLEAVSLRIDGALTVLQELLDAPEPASTVPLRAMADSDFAPSWQAPVAP